MSSNDQAPLGCVFDDDNIQRDNEFAPDGFDDIDAVAYCLTNRENLAALGAVDENHLYGCAIATLLAHMGIGEDSGHAHQIAWDFLNVLEGAVGAVGDDETT